MARAEIPEVQLLEKERKTSFHGFALPLLRQSEMTSERLSRCG